MEIIVYVNITWARFCDICFEEMVPLLPTFFFYKNVPIINDVLIHDNYNWLFDYIKVQTILSGKNKGFIIPIHPLENTL